MSSTELPTEFFRRDETSVRSKSVASYAENNVEENTVVVRAKVLGVNRPVSFAHGESAVRGKVVDSRLNR